MILKTQNCLSHLYSMAHLLIFAGKDQTLAYSAAEDVEHVLLG